MHIHTVAAFAHQPLAGNPAAVCVLSAPADERWMQRVACKMGLSETAFLHPIAGGYALRWFTPVVEVALCGHATLASAFTLWETGALRAGEAAHFHTQSGSLTCQREGGWIEMDFPANVCQPCSTPPGLAEALGCEMRAVGTDGTDYLVEIADEKTLRTLKPDFTALARLPARGIIATCRSESPEFDFVSRFFAPAVGIPEDPVTGSAHCTLGPYWQARLGQSDFAAYQASPRGGIVKLSVRAPRMLLRGQAVMMSRIKWTE